MRAEIKREAIAGLENKNEEILPQNRTKRKRWKVRGLYKEIPFLNRRSGSEQ